MKVIAISDAPIPEKGYYHKGVYYDRAYYKGNIFEVLNRSTWGTEDHLIIYHDKLETTMDVDPTNFITLEEFRNQKLDKLGI